MEILDLEQLRNVTLDDEELMREVVEALIDDTSRQLPALHRAIEEGNSGECMRLAHYSKGACANVGARSSAALLQHIERRAAQGRFEECATSLASLAEEMGKLRAALG
ncbi:MAG: Hpt domain-containing protein [Acidobacteria bacterium]|nr:Hpt domain-containing protein [Acidobacteriota bacterium]